LVVLGLVGVGSAVVAGSIAVVGNVVHWAEHKSNCTQEPAAPQEMTPTESYYLGNSIERDILLP
jgi:hypothetical protein